MVVYYLLLSDGIDNPISFIALLTLITPVIVVLWEERQKDKAEEEHRYNAKHHPLKNLNECQRRLWEELYQAQNDPQKQQEIIKYHESFVIHDYDRFRESKQKLENHLGPYMGMNNWYSKFLKEEIDKYRRSLDVYDVLDKNDNWVGVIAHLPDWHVTPEERKRLLGED